MSRIAARSRFSSMISSGITPVGSFVMSIDPAVTALLASSGYDFVIIDREHGPIDVQSAANHVRAAEANGIVPIVRVLTNDPTQIQQSLDIGAHGIVVPKVGSAEQARAAVRATQYTAGGRGMCPATEGARWSSGQVWTENRDNANAEVVVIPLIETQAGIDNLAEIAAVDGIDLVFFGLADLSQDMGIGMYTDLAQLVEIWNRAVKVAKAAGVAIGAPLGYGFTGGDYGTVESDFNLLKSAAVTGLAEVRAGALSVTG